MPISPKVLLFSEVGVKRNIPGLDYSLAYSKLFREMIIRHAHRYVYADRPQKGMLALNARVVNRDIYEHEKQSIQVCLSSHASGYGRLSFSWYGLWHTA